MNNIQNCLKVFVLALLLGFTYQAKAGHLQGGELRYKCLDFATNQYELELWVYLDSAGVTLPDTANGIAGNVDDDAIVFAIRDSAESIRDTAFRLPVVSNIKIVKEIIGKCNGVKSRKALYKMVYRDTVTIVPTTVDYRLTYFRCCRDETVIDNLELNVDSESPGLTIITRLPSAATLNGVPNSTPVFDVDIPAFTCISSPFNIDMSATDEDGDSLVYEIVNPFHGAGFQIRYDELDDDPYWSLFPWEDWPAENLTFANGYSYLDPFGTGDLAIDAQTGMLTGTATAVGAFQIAVAVKEYRNGVLYTSRIRDFIMNTVDCGEVYSTPIDENITAEGKSCGLTVQFTTDGNGNKFRWDFGDGSTLADTTWGDNPSYSYPAYGQYSVSLRAIDSISGCDTIISAVIDVVEDDITAAFDYSSDCDTLETVFISRVNATNPIETYAWTYQGGTNTTDSFAVNFASTGDYVVKLVVTDTNGCVDSITRTVPVATAVIADFNIGLLDSISCSTNVQFNNTSLGASGFTWVVGANGDSLFTSNPSYDYPSLGNYTVKLIALDTTGACSSDTITKQITVANMDSVFFARPTKECDTSLLRMTAISVPANNDVIFEWGYGNPAALSLDTADILNLTLLSSGNLTVRLVGIDTTSGCTDTMSYSGYYAPALKANFRADNSVNEPTFSCGLGADFNNRSTGALTYHWDFGTELTASSGSDSSIQNNPNHLYPSAGQYTVTLIAKNLTTTDPRGNTCADTVATTLHVLEKPVADSIAFDRTEVCEDERITLNAITSSGGLTSTGGAYESYAYVFSYLGGNNYENTDEHTLEWPLTAQNLSVTLTYEGIVSINGVAVSCSSDVNTNHTTVVPFGYMIDPEFSIDNSLGQGYVCSLTPDISNNTSSSNVDTYEWNYGDGSTNEFALNPSHTYSEQGEFDISVLATHDITGCEYTDTVSVTVSTGPTANFSYDPFCENFTYMVNDLSESGYMPINTWVYDYPDGTPAEQPDGQTSFELEFAKDSTYTIRLMVRDPMGCIDSISKDVDYAAIPSPKFTVYSDSNGTVLSSAINEGDPIFISIDDPSKIPTGYVWEFEDDVQVQSTLGKDQEYLTDPSVMIQHNYYNEGKYYITLTAGVKGGQCVGIVTDSIIVNSYLEHKVPLVFSPNNDGNNDELVFAMQDIEDFKISIYNRWGNLVYYSDDHVSATWNGRNIYNDQEVPAGVYVYVLEAKQLSTGEDVVDEKGKQLKGEITLVR